MSEKKERDSVFMKYLIIESLAPPQCMSGKTQMSGWQNELLRGASSADCMAAQLGKKSLVTDSNLNGMCQW